MNRIIFGAILAGLPVLAAPASAGFFLEGLSPYSTSYCDGRRAELHDPLVKAPPETWVKTSPKADSLAGDPAWIAANCPSGKAAAPARAPRHHKPAQRVKPVQTGVPQK